MLVSHPKGRTCDSVPEESAENIWTQGRGSSKKDKLYNDQLLNLGIISNSFGII
jgi:hypothetical protein